MHSSNVPALWRAKPSWEHFNHNKHLSGGRATSLTCQKLWKEILWNRFAHSFCSNRHFGGTFQSKLTEHELGCVPHWRNLPWTQLELHGQPAESQAPLCPAWCPLDTDFCGICHPWRVAALFLGFITQFRMEPLVPGAVRSLSLVTFSCYLF